MIKVCNPAVVCLFVCISFVLNNSALSQENPIHVRQNLQAFVQDQSKLVSLIRGVLEMQRRNDAPRDSAEYRTSWEYWAAIHGYPGASSPYGTFENFRDQMNQSFPDDAPLYAGFYEGLKNLDPPASPAGLAESIWATCEHGTRHFLSWHRMYLYFFERVLRDASGDPNFALPYWDYTNDAEDPVEPANAPWKIPTIFSISSLQTGSGEIPNPLHERRRTSGFGAAVQLDPALTNIDATLAVNDFFDFQDTLDGGLHGFIHCAVGNSCLAPYIGLVPFAGSDPIFWHHHANVDRLWDCWSNFHGRDANPTTDVDWMNQEFSFVDENGHPVKMAVKDLFDENGPIDYRYDNALDCFRETPTTGAILVSTARDTLAASEMTLATTKDRRITELSEQKDIVISNADQSFRLMPVAESADRFEMMAAVSRPTSLTPTKAKLRLIGVRPEKEPGASIGVFVGNAETAKRLFVGLISFFTFGESGGQHSQSGHGMGNDYLFDISPQIRKLFSDEFNQFDVAVSFAAVSGMSEGGPEINSTRYREARIGIEKISLEIEEETSEFDLR